MTDTFIHLHTHSYFSFLDGVLSPDQLVECAINQGMSALALTDRHGLTGAIKFYVACQNAGIKPILGLEVVNKHPFGKGNLILISANLKGWNNLCRLSSLIQCCDGRDYNEGILLSRLTEFSDNVICLSGGKASLINSLISQGNETSALQYLNQLKEIYDDRIYLEMQIQEPNDLRVIRKLISINRALNIKPVATNNVHYHYPEQARLQRTLCAIRLNTPITMLKENRSTHHGSHFTSQKEMAKRFVEFPEAIKNTIEISERCSLELPLGVPHFPKIDLPPGKTDIEILEALTRKGAINKYGEISATIQERLDHELNAIEKRGYASLFLIVREIMQFARKSGIPTSSRGSAASSLVAYCLGLTSPEPIALDLYFERFLNPARSSPPDIDTDICSKRRSKVIQFVYDNYGINHVAMVATINRFQRRSALREVAKAYGLSINEIKELAQSLPNNRRGSPSRQRGDLKTPFRDLPQKYQSPQYKNLLNDAMSIIGFPRHLSIHPGGIVITPHPITDLVPTHLAKKGLRITQFGLKSIENLGLVKIDLLGTRGLTVLGDVAEKVREWRSMDFINSLEVLDSIPDDDIETKELLLTGQTIGCFAVESPGMRNTLSAINACSQDDIMIALALYRPGPMTGGLKDAFIGRHLGIEPIKHIHPALANLLENTHGVILYQEQVLRIASELAGLNLSDADLLRRAMSHFDPGEQMKTLKKRFIIGSREKSGVEEDIGEQIWEMMAAFAGYGFPKAHAASYALVAWRSIWCKTHYPAEFMAAVLAGGGGYYRQYVYINEARRLGMTIRPPHVNHSKQNFSCTYPEGNPILYMGLDQVSGLSQVTQNRTLQTRPFSSLDDFLSKVDPSPKEISNLIQVNAFQGMGTISDLIFQVKDAGWQKDQPRLFPSITQNSGRRWNSIDHFEAQTKILGIGIDPHPVKLVEDQINELGAVTTAVAKQKMDSSVCVVGVKQTLQRFYSSSTGIIYLLELADTTGVLPVRVSESVFKRYEENISKSKPFAVEGLVVVDKTKNSVLLDAKKIFLLEWKLGE